MPRVRAWPSLAEAKLLGFPCYKAGTTHALIVDDHKHSPTFGSEIFIPATIFDAPPVKVFAVKAYKKTVYGLRTAFQVFSAKLDKDLERAISLPKKKIDEKGSIASIEEAKAKNAIHELRVLVHTQPRLTSLPKKKPEIMEIAVGGSLDEKLEYIKSVLGKEVKISNVFKAGDYADTIGITKGKGTQGVVKRFGIKLRQHKSRKGRRKVGTLGPWHPAATMRSVAQTGQMGFQQRTEYNKRVLKIGENGSEITPKGGFLHYGIVKGSYAVLAGSSQGPAKRLIFLRHAIRLPEKAVIAEPTVTYISTESKQGR